MPAAGAFAARAEPYRAGARICVTDPIILFFVAPLDNLGFVDRTTIEKAFAS